MPTPWTRPLRGIVVPLVTPLIEPNRLDLAGLERLIEHVIKGGVNAIFVLGTTGEGPLLDEPLRYELVSKVCSQVRGRVPVLVGITDTVLASAVRLTAHAAEAGASAVVTSAPYYLKPGQPELARFVTALADRVALPLFLYNMPGHTRVTFGPDVIRQALQHPNIVGLKDSSGEMSYIHAARRLIAPRSDWSLLVGPEHLTAETVLFGGHGGVNGGANAWPELFVNLYQAASTGDLSRTNALQQQLLDFGRIYQIGQHESAVIKGLKCALACLGICSDVMTEPFDRFHERERSEVMTILKSCGLLKS